MPGTDRRASEGDSGERLARIRSVFESIDADLKQLLERWLPRLQELGCLSDIVDGGLKVLTQVEVTPPFVCIVGLCSPKPLDRLAPRERQVAQLVRAGRSNKEIAKELRISPETVATYVKRIYGKLGIHSRVFLSQQARLLS